MTKKLLRTGEVAARAGVTVATLRYYERRGLIPVPTRTAGGFREYSPETVDVLRMIHRAKELGFTLREIRRLKDLNANPDASCADIHALAEKKQRDIEEQLRNLAQSRDTLRALLCDCSAKATPAKNCPVLKFLVSPPDGERAAT
jgi:MerR family transcriptional regulator, copper efflux regulator